MDVGKLSIAILAIVLCAAVFAGEYFTYYSGIHEYDASVEVDGSEVHVSISSSGSDAYTAVLIDNGGSGCVESVLIYVDENYDEYYKVAKAETSALYIEQRYLAEQIQNALENRSFDDVRLVGSADLEAFLDSTADPSSFGLVVMSYALPSTVYTGNIDDPLMKWVSAGGTLYWIGSEIGAYFTDSDGLHRVEGNQVLFFGKECVNTSGPTNATSVVDNGFRECLSLKNNKVLFGLDTNGIDGALQMGYIEDGFASISMVPHGSGAICVFGGGFDIDLIDDIGQIIAAGISPQSVIIDVSSGDVTRSKTVVTLAPLGSDSIVYAYVGGTYMKYGEAFRV